jgi:glycosyltransferase involved in cell wall biosynthesis
VLSAQSHRRSIISMTNAPLVSILAVTYNHEKFISEFIESVLLQTYRNIELIIADDGSQDSAPQIIHKYSMKDKRIKPIFSTLNKGLTANFNQALALCKGEFIAPIAGDDVMMVNKIETQVRFFIGHRSCGALSHDSLVIDDEGRDLYEWSSHHRPIVGRVEAQFQTNWLLQKDCRPAPPSMMYRSAYITDTKYDGRIPVGNEWLHSIECSIKNPNLVWCYIPNILSKYRRSSRQMSQDSKISLAYYEERMLVLAIANAKYPELSSLISACRAYNQFIFLLFGWHPLVKRKKYEQQFLKEVGLVKWLYLKVVSYLLHHPWAMNSTRSTRKVILSLLIPRVGLQRRK